MPGPEFWILEVVYLLTFGVVEFRRLIFIVDRDGSSVTFRDKIVSSEKDDGRHGYPIDVDHRMTFSLKSHRVRATTQ